MKKEWTDGSRIQSWAFKLPSIITLSYRREIYLCIHVIISPNLIFSFKPYVYPERCYRPAIALAMAIRSSVNSAVI
jgi:hypothetical protein